MIDQTKPSPPVGIDAFHRDRSRCVDAFALAELQVNALLDLTGSKRGSEPLKQRIVNLRKAQPSPRYSKARKQRVVSALEELEARLPMRADIVHGCLQIAEFKTEARACFANARHDDLPGVQLRTFTLLELREVTREVNEIASRLAA